MTLRTRQDHQDTGGRTDADGTEAAHEVGSGGDADEATRHAVSTERLDRQPVPLIVLSENDQFV